MGYIWGDGRLRLRMSKQIPVIAPVLADRAVSRLLAQQHLSQRDIAHWVIHAAGNRILTNIGGALGLPEEKLTLSRETLLLFGNTSSTSVGITGKRLMESGAWRPGDYVVMVSLGPGMSSGATLLRFPKVGVLTGRGYISKSTPQLKNKYLGYGTPVEEEL